MREPVFPKEIEQILRQIPEEQSTYVKDYFRNAPEDVLGTMTVETRKVNRLLAEENESIEKVYVLMEGQVKAVDFRVKGTSYEYAHFGPIAMLGSMECLFDLNRYATTLMTDSACTLVSIPKVNFEKWLNTDPHAMLKETASMRDYLLECTRESRMMLMLSGTERLMYLLTKKCEKLGRREEYLLAVNRQELAEQSGSSVKTVNRSMKKLEESDMVLRVGHKVKVTQNQYSAMKSYLGEILNYTAE